MENDGEVALRWLKSSEPPLYLSPSSELSAAARLACKYLYSSLKPFTPKSPFEQLLTDGFDAEQIWQQIDIQSEPLLSALRRRVSHFEKNLESISEQFNVEPNGLEKKSGLLEVLDKEGYDIDDADLNDFDEDEDEGEDEDEDEDEGDEEEDDGTGLVEDEFLKIKELEKFLADDEAREYGYEEDDKAKKKKKRKRVEQSESEEENVEEEDETLEDVDLEDDTSDADGDMENARYEDFFARKTDHKGKRKPLDRSDHMEMDEEVSDDDNQGNQNLSTHEQELLKLRSTIEEMEKANVEPKAWTMQGEVTAAKRPKNSALEVDLDFEHNVRPAPVITEEVTLSLEELIRKRVLEEQFDDVQKPPSLPSRAPREIKEVDDNKSKKGLAEVYEEEYVQKTGLVSTAMTFSDEQKKEATMLFKKLCLKLDALSHFHFTPKPVIEDMSIQASVPALAMEEIAPVATSDAAMLAPEEVFIGKGDIKEEAELTQAERKRRRAKKKSKFKAEASNRKAPQNTSKTDSESKEQS
ncbi:PREDICTED: U3 small nucleolar ribonucleoprotein protein MPP10-like isoform X2 [Ipomoea nil]|uniref:U3 small nucleolar ribonucleoprotein protein MPP10-like isoform X2 n=1 Tax=Ipomoea nil TaxID=35883 RepID=UPI000901A631|nr:PREDICTED: U3 small nucleolar ribonucleoprotein protein MPP10-like isoform X2 [Ipomoea nil]